MKVDNGVNMNLPTLLAQCARGMGRPARQTSALDIAFALIEGHAVIIAPLLFPF